MQNTVVIVSYKIRINFKIRILSIYHAWAAEVHVLGPSHPTNPECARYKQLTSQTKMKDYRKAQNLGLEMKMLKLRIIQPPVSPNL